MKQSMFLALLGLFAVVNAEFPATYPFENEDVVPPKLPASTPSRTYGADDVGGYIYTYLYMQDLDEWPFPYCPVWGNNGEAYVQYTLVNTFGVKAATLPSASWNCTSKDLFFDSADFTGSVDGVAKVCSIGSCCSHLYNLLKFSDDQFSWHDWLGKLTAPGQCDDIENEMVYCMLVGGHYQMNCYEYYISPTDRLTQFGCFDTQFTYWMTCILFRNTPLNFGFDIEPPLYDSMLSLEQIIVVQVTNYAPDRVCMPNSYYKPSGFASSSVGSTSAATASTAALLFGIVMVALI